MPPSPLGIGGGLVEEVCELAQARLACDSDLHRACPIAIRI